MDNNDGVVLLKGGITYNDVRKDSLLQNSLNVLEDFSRDILVLMEDAYIAIRELVNSINSFSDKIWEFLLEDVKSFCANYVIDSLNALKQHFTEGCHFVKEALCSLFRGDIEKALHFSYQSLDHIAFFIDIFSYIPALNVVAGILLAIIYLIQKKWGMAVVSLVFIIPFLKWFKKVPFVKNIILSIEKYVDKLSKTFFKGKKGNKVIDIRKEMKKRNKKHESTSNISIKSGAEKAPELSPALQNKVNKQWNMKAKKNNVISMPIYEERIVANGKTERVVVGYRNEDVFQHNSVNEGGGYFDYTSSTTLRNAITGSVLRDITNGIIDKKSKQKPKTTEKENKQEREQKYEKGNTNNPFGQGELDNSELLGEEGYLNPDVLDAPSNRVFYFIFKNK